MTCRIPHTARVFALVAALVLVVGCDGIVDKIDEERAILGRYEANAAPDSLLVRFVPGAAYDELNETPYLPDTTFDLLERGGRFELELREGDGPANKGTANIGLMMPDTLFVDSDSSYQLVPAGNLSFESEYISVIDRIVLDAADDSTGFLPMRWRVGTRGRLDGDQQFSVVRPVTRFDTQRGKYVTRNETLGTAYVRVTLRKE